MVQASQVPSHLILVGRTKSRIQECIVALKTRFPDVSYHALLMDLSSQKSVRTAATEVLSWPDIPTIDIIVNSAAVGLLEERTINEDGIEMQFATNHIGHFLFTCLIMPKLIKSAETSKRGATRIINVSALSPMFAAMRWSDINFEMLNTELPQAEQPAYAVHKAWSYSDPEGKSYLPLEGYNQSKVANVLFSIAANKRLYEKFGILSLSLHPGVIQTELTRNATPVTMAAIDNMKDQGLVKYKTLGAGSSTTLVAALDPRLGIGSKTYGAYLMDCQVYDESGFRAVTDDEAEKLWELSEKLVKERFSW
jgi:NAD(P)-dependent dehydrogenase (short-subunit alcohol dehydrogenase family)